MHFLCPVHRQHIFSLPCDQQMLIWLEWMGQAASFYQHQQWQEAVPYLGCGFELSGHLLQQGGSGLNNAAIQLTLSSIYLNNVLRHCADKHSADQTIGSALRLFHDCLQQQPQSLLSDYIGVLLNEQQYEAFFSRYLNLPFEDVSALNAVLH